MMPRFAVTTIGEGQLRYSVPVGQYLEKAVQLEVHATGTEANVTSLLSRLGWRCGWVTSLPNTPLGRRIATEYEASGLDLSAVVWSEQYRVATYYVQFGLPPQATQVYYDRENTCFVNLNASQINWDYLLDTRLLHLSGLTVPLSASVHALMQEAIQRAKARSIPVSFDMNYRSRIWSPEEAAKVIAPILEQVDILFFARSDAQRMYGMTGNPEHIVRQLGTLTPAQHIVTSLSSEGIIGWDRQTFFFQPAHNVPVLDRIGAGDAMVGGVLHGWLQNDFAKGLRYGVTTAALALTHYGDAVLITAPELESLIESPLSDIVR